MSSLQTFNHFKLHIQKVDEHTRGKWLIHGTKRRKDNPLQSLELPAEYPSRERKHDIKSSKVTCSIQYSRRMSRGGSIRGVAHSKNQNYLVTESPNV